ncbi:MAG: TetR/AcrR family transcriptional regulator [Phenylobacterium sp.]|uniref:TetR/AcrR family transcriptional regulator n=1 Tax=Phenylobacterium sp. TaxID=1871053 RepID=UPI0027186DCE|nr:TetR/AcrR family transcriptional regulator [Phenylobacterium sp.]MDO8913381.1 TetR/AcrR family transcriptional regulator [Phenylobacterium sp.]MDP3101226.1 TetR/AcrR family transcriptional regulator [Phenylobacterium sp.]HQT54808.1 TetR/AcrR family transcriptional regulator [Phenylobacterium sp.]
MTEVATLTAARGRPRDPSLEARVFDAAMALYAEAGWSGFNFDTVARRAGVGKASLYSRWPNRGELLRHTFQARWLTVATIDTGCIRGDLEELAWMIARTLTGPYSEAHPRMSLDAAQHPEMLDFLRPYSEATIRHGRAIVRRAIARGEITPAVNPGLMMDLVVGAVTNHVRTTPERLRGAMVAKMQDFISELVEAVLRGVRATETTENDKKSGGLSA